MLDETQEAVEYQRVGVAVSLGPACATLANDDSCPGGHACHARRWPPRARAVSVLHKGLPPLPTAPTQPRTSAQLVLLQQIDELLAGSFTQEDEDAILKELNEITQVSGPAGPGRAGHGGDGAVRVSCPPWSWPRVSTCVGPHLSAQAGFAQLFPAQTEARSFRPLAGRRGHGKNGRGSSPKTVTGCWRDR